MLNNNVIYLDNNATTAMKEEVKIFLLEHSAIPLNPSSVHSFGRKARKLVEEARVKIADGIGANLDKYRIIFTSSGTEANNMLINSFAGKNIWVSNVEHLSILKPSLRNNNTKLIPVNNNGLIDVETLERYLKEFSKPELLSIILANNETGVIQDISSIAQFCKKNEILLHCDAVQALGKVPLSIVDIGADMITISSHKCGGPIGAGALVADKKINLHPFVEGGGQEQNLRAGTENTLAISGFGEAVRLSKNDLNQYLKLESMRDQLELDLKNFCPDLEIVNYKSSRLPNTSCIIMPNVKSETQLISFDLAGIAISSGSACSSGKVHNSHVLQAIGIDPVKANCAIRVSLGVNTTIDELNKFKQQWKAIYQRSNELLNKSLSA